MKKTLFPFAAVLLATVVCMPSMAESNIESIRNLTDEQETELKQLNPKGDEDHITTTEIQEQEILTGDQYRDLSRARSQDSKGTLLIDKNMLKNLSCLTPEQHKKLDQLAYDKDDVDVLVDVQIDKILTEKQKKELEMIRDGHTVIQEDIVCP